jgi:excisionase family DNA binding protein
MNYLDQQFKNFIEQVCSELNHPIRLIGAPSRKQSNVTIRHCIFYSAKYHFGLSCITVGEMFNRDHSSVVYSYKSISKKIKNKRLNHLEKKCLHIIETVLNGNKPLPDAKKIVEEKNIVPSISVENKHNLSFMNLLTVKEVSEIFNCTPTTVRDMIKKKDLHSVSLPGNRMLRVPVSELKEYLLK